MNKNQTWIAVPTYWTFAAGEPGKELTAFDHPTPLDEEGTLVRTLESFRALSGEFTVLVVAAGTNPVIGQRVHDRVASLIRPFAKDFPLCLVSPANLPALNGLLSEAILALDSYGYWESRRVRHRSTVRLVSGPKYRNAVVTHMDL